VTTNGKFSIIGLSCKSAKEKELKLNGTTKNILLMHYPNWVKKLGGLSFDLMLAGHSHGGQVRIPFYGALFVPYGVDEYDMGSFSTPSGPLYVNPGIGWFPWPIRFNCRPEITVFEA
jgi:predicted MPP superfamily phosphohydrolase